MQAANALTAPTRATDTTPFTPQLLSIRASTSAAPSPVDDSRPPSPASLTPAGPAVLIYRTGESTNAHSPIPTMAPDPTPIPSTSASPLRYPSSPASPDVVPASGPKRVLLRRPSSPAAAIEQPEGSAPGSASNRTADGSMSDLAQRTAELALQDTPTGRADGDRDTQSDRSTHSLDPVLHAALNHPRDRLLLLRAEVEMERFVASPSLTRLPLAPPHFQPGLNSYQRLLIHRLADTFGITREVEAAPPVMWNAGMINPATGQPQGVVVLVKTETSRAPAVKLAIHVPAPEVTPPNASASGTPPTLPSRPSTPSAAESPAPSLSSSNPAPVAPSPVFKILPRSATSRGASSTSSSVVGEDDGVSSASTGTSARGSKGRRELSLIEREAAYKEARDRIFSQPDTVTAPPHAPASVASSSAGGVNDDAQSVQSAGYGITRPSSAGSTLSRSSAALSVSGQRPPPSLISESSSTGVRGGYGSSMYYAHATLPHPGLQYGSMRPAVGSFDPATGSWIYGQAGSTLVAPEHPSYHYVGGVGGAYPYPANGAYAAYAPPSLLEGPSAPSPYDPTMPGPHSAWSISSSSARGLPSPALSTSSGGSSFPPFPPSVAPSSSAAMPPPPPRAPSGASAGSSDSGANGGYLMRFPEGAVVTPGGGIVGPPSPYATVAATGSSGVLKTHNGADASRAASLAAEGEADSSSSAGRSDAASGSSDGRRRARQSTVVQPVKEDPVMDPMSPGPGTVLGPASTARHPSLPAKPVWVASQPPPERPAPATAASAAPTTPPVRHSQPLPPPVPSFGAPGIPPFMSGPPPQSANGPSAGFHAPPHVPGPGGWPRQGGPPGSSYSSTSGGVRGAEYPALHGPAATYPGSAGSQAYYSQPSQAPLQQHVWHHAESPAQQPISSASMYDAAAVPPSLNTGEGLLGLPEMRRPPPRSTQLFDPNKPMAASFAGGASAQGMGIRRGGSAVGQGRRG